MSDPEIERIMKKKMEEMMKQNNTVLELNERNFDDVISSAKPVLVDFWATWCGPCQYMHPIFEKLAKKHSEKVIFARLNVDDNPAVAARYDVYAIPTFILFMDGKVIERAIGAVGEIGLEKIVKKYE